ncbi:MAG: NifB/NifX family molybdenum-iron cluster-binding protein [Halanaeroarchaeum sp.]
MRVCFPTADDDGRDATLVEHFGRAPYYTIVDTKTDAVEPIRNESKHRGGEQPPPAFLADHGVDAVVAGHIGRRGVRLFETHDVDVYRGGEGTVSDLLERWRAGDLDEIHPADAHGHGGGGRGHDHSGHGHNHSGHAN